MTDPRANDAAPKSTDAVDGAASITGQAGPGVAAALPTSLPGEHRGGYERALTDPVPITAPVHQPVEWAPQAPLMPRSAGWAITFAIAGLFVSFFVGWGFLIGMLGAGLAIAALRRPWESKMLAVWALALSILSVLYSAGWLWWVASQGQLFA